MDVDIIIPVYKPGKAFLELLDNLNSQTHRPKNIILMNTEKQYFEILDSSGDFYNKYPNVSVYHVTKADFDHGATRREGVGYSKSPIFIMMTQDAIPADEFLIEKLVFALTNGDASKEIAVAYARQLADDNCGVLEKSSRIFNYPEESITKGIDDLPKLGIKTYFCSDVCAAYKREIYDKVGGFVKRTLFNEDMIFAANAISLGYFIRYEASAKVYHSHNYTNSQQFHRNFDLGVSQAQHPEVFAGLKSEGEGKKLVKSTVKRLRETGEGRKIPHFYMQCVCKYAGYLLGKNYKRLPKGMVRKCTTNPGYFERINDIDMH